MKMVTASAATEDCSPVGQEDMQHLRKISSSFTKHLEMLADAAEQDIGPSGQTPSSPTHQVHAFDPTALASNTVVPTYSLQTCPGAHINLAERSAQA